MRLYILFCIIGFVVAMGCSGGGKNPVTPSESREPGTMDTIPLIGLSEAGEASNAIGLLGAYELSVNAEKLTAELVSKRFGTIGESYIVNGMTFFTVAPCKDCLRISGVGLTQSGNLELVFTLKHPFQVGNPHKPPSGTNRNDLDLFDPALVIKPNEVTPTNYALFKLDAYDGYCITPDGFTRELENVTGESALYPYYLAIDDSDTGAKNYNRFSQGSSRTFSAFLKPASQLYFDLYLTFGYGVSAGFMDRLNPKYFNPEFNRKNAWKVQVNPPNGNIPPRLGNTWQEHDATTKYSVTVKVWDWQQGVASINNPPVDIMDLAFASNIASVSVEIPGMTNEIVTTEMPDNGSGSDPRFPMIYHVPIANENLLPPGEYLSLVKVTDQRVPPIGGGPGTIDTMIDVPTPGTFEWCDIPEFATYQTFIATIVHEPCEVTGSITSPDADDYSAYSTEVVNFTVEGIPFGHNVLVAYWADWGTGTYTESNTTGEFSHEFIDTDCPVFADDQYTVKFGVELECTEGDTIPIDEILIKMTCPPCNATGSIISPVETSIDVMNGETLDFELEATPNGGEIIAYWADWGTGTYTESTTDPTFSHQFISDDCPPFDNAPPDVGDLTLTVNRQYGGLGFVIAPNLPFTLAWEAAGGTPDEVFTVKFGVELDCWPGNINHIGTRTIKVTSCYDYEIMWDNDPDDGLTNNPELVDTVSKLSWNAPTEHLNVNGTHYVKGSTYLVYSKNCLGIRSTNPSEPAHVIISGAETLASGQPYNAEGWTVNNRSGNTSSHLYAPYTSTYDPAHGSFSIRFGDKIGQAVVGTWEGISRMTPTVPNSSVRFLEFSAFKHYTG